MIAIKVILIISLMLAFNYEYAFANNFCMFEGCDCTQEHNGEIIVICENFSDDKNIGFPKRNLNYMTLTPIFVLYISNYRFKQIPDDSFEGLNIRNMALVSNGLETITKNAFRNVLSINNLAITDKITKIETDAFFHLKDKIDELELSSAGITNQIFDSFIPEIKILANLKSLVLSDNLITNLNKEWLKYFPNLEKLDLRGNSLSSLDEAVFDGNKKLKSLILSNNKFNDLSVVTRALSSIKGTLETLFLAENSFRSIEAGHFQNFARLITLGLNNNQIERIDENSFNNNKELIGLGLTGNLLKQMPNIKSLTKLHSLEMENQNGQLTELVDYAFERNSNAYGLYLKLNTNKIVKLGNKAFCTRNSISNIFDKVVIDYDSMKLIDKCILKQMGLFYSRSNPVYIEVVSSTKSNSYSEVCNCDLQMFLNKFNIKLIGVCSRMNLACSNRQVQDDCVNKKEYFCENPNTKL
jgi:Leucine-rich repeat (LRR) protein